MVGKKYNFDAVIDRKGTFSEKWDEADRLFHGEQLMPLWVADMDFQVSDAVTEALSARIRHGIYGYTVRPQSYFDAVRTWMAERHRWLIENDWICHSPGVVTALNLLIAALTEAGDKVLIQPPVYPPFAQAIQNQQRLCVTSPLIHDSGHYYMDFTDLEHKFSDPKVTMMILCSPHNPVGRVWSEQELRKLSDLALKYDVLVVADEIHNDLVFKGHVHTPYAKLSEAAAARSIVCTAPSKTFNIAGLQVSNIIIPDASLRDMYLRQTKRFSLGEPNTLGLTAAEAAYRFGGDWLDQCIDYIEHNVVFVDTFLKKHIPALKMTRPEGTYLIWIDCRALNLSDGQLAHLLVDEARLALNPGVTFGKQGSGFVRMNLACPRALLQEAMERLHTALQNREQQAEQ